MTGTSDGAELAGREEKLHDLGGGAVEVGDAGAGGDSQLEEGLGQSARALVELGVGQCPIALTDGDDVRTLGRVGADHVGDPELGAAGQAHIEVNLSDMRLFDPIENAVLRCR